MGGVWGWGEQPVQRPWGRTGSICEGWEKRAEWEPGWILQGLRAVGTLSVRPGRMQRCAHPVSHEGASGVSTLPPSSRPCRHLPGARAGPRDPDLLTGPALGRAGALPAPGTHPAALRPHPGRQGAELRAGGGPAPGGSRSMPRLMPRLIFLSSPCPHPSPPHTHTPPPPRLFLEPFPALDSLFSEAPAQSSFHWWEGSRAAPGGFQNVPGLGRTHGGGLTRMSPWMTLRAPTSGLVDLHPHHGSRRDYRLQHPEL